MALQDISHDEVNGAWVTGSLATIYTVPNSPNRVALMVSLYFCNQDTSSRQLEIQIIQSGGVAANTKRVVFTAAGNHLLPGEHREYTFANLKTGTFIQVKSDVTDKISVHGGITLKEVA